MTADPTPAPPGGNGALRHLRRWTIDTALPFWLEDGRNAASARFHERLGQDGAPLDVPHRAMVQARQVFVFAEATRRGWIASGDAPAAAFRLLERTQIERADGCASVAFAVHPDGTVAASYRDAYTHAFLLLAIAALYRWTGDKALLVLAGEVTAFVDRHLTDRAHGGLFDRLPEPPPFKRQNPVMHLFEAYLALAEADPGGHYLDRAAALARLFRRRLFTADRAALPEYFAPDWRDHPTPGRADLFEPGHHFEWTWLLDRFARLSGERLPWADALFASASSAGVSPAGLVFDEVHAASRRPGGAHRLWPHGEAIRAALVRPEAGATADGDMAGRMAETLVTHFLGRPFAAGWIDRIDAAGRPLVDHVPASSLYHLAIAAFEVERWLSRADVLPGR